MKSIRIVSVFCLISLISWSAYAASFDCGKVDTFIERLICSDAGLSELDDAMMVAYKRARTQSKDPRSIGVDHRAWLKNVRNACRDVACLQRAYEDQIMELESIPSDKPVLWEGQWRRRAGAQNTVMELVVPSPIHDKGFDFTIEAVKGEARKTIEGHASFFKDKVIYQYQAMDCVMQFQSQDRCIAIHTTKTCAGLGDVGGDLSGIYCKE